MKMSTEESGETLDAIQVEPTPELEQHARSVMEAFRELIPEDSKTKMIWLNLDVPGHPRATLLFGVDESSEELDSYADGFFRERLGDDVQA
jgi:hypothetical protein